MANYYLTNKAVEDLTSIWNYTLIKWSENQAEKYYELLTASFKEIASNPNLGKKYKEISASLFGIHINKHIVFYRIIDSAEIEISRILHDSMDLKKRVFE